MKFAAKKQQQAKLKVKLWRAVIPQQNASVECMWYQCIETGKSDTVSVQIF